MASGSFKVTGIKSLPYDKISIQPQSISSGVVTIGAVKYVAVDKIVTPKKGKPYETTDIDKFPLVLMWDGKEMNWALGMKGQELESGDDKYLIDRNVGMGVPLPSESLIEYLMDNRLGAEMINEFDATEFFNEIYSYFKRYFYLEKDYLYTMITLYVANMWVFDAHDSTPYLFIRSPMRGCGKTYIGTSIANMSNGEMIATPNAVHIFRMSHDTKTPMVMDEIKKLTSAPDKLSQDDKDILSLINTGFQKYGCKVPRAAETQIGGNKAYKIEMYESYTPKVLITTDGVLPHDTMSRCLDLRMQMASPRGPNYDERWNEPERLERLQKIRDMGTLFRLKHGSEIYRISKDIEHRKELDPNGLFDGIHGRTLEIFRPLIILSLKYMPIWNGQLERYVRKFIEIKANSEPPQVHLILEALRHIHKDVSDNSYGSFESMEHGTISLEDDDVYGKVLNVPVRYIVQVIDDTTSFSPFGDSSKAPQRVDAKLNELGFVTLNKDKGMRTIKVKQLKEVCERYMGVGLDDGTGDSSLSQADRQREFRASMIKNKDGITFNELLDDLEGKVSEEQLESMLKKSTNEIGGVVKEGDKYKWTGA